MIRSLSRRFIAGAVAWPAAMLFGVQGLAAQRGTLQVSVNAASDSLRDTPVLVSLLSDGRVIAQSEVLPGERAMLQGPIGLVDLRAEGAGMTTEFKHGVHTVNPMQQAPGTFEFVMRPGEGLRILEYAEGGLAREEVAHRLRVLEATVVDLQSVIDSLRADVAAVRDTLERIAIRR